LLKCFIHLLTRPFMCNIVRGALSVYKAVDLCRCETKARCAGSGSCCGCSYNGNTTSPNTERLGMGDSEALNCENYRNLSFYPRPGCFDAFYRRAIALRLKSWKLWCKLINFLRNDLLFNCCSCSRSATFQLRPAVRLFWDCVVVRLFLWGR
jgi:hypothetical protein